MRSVYISFTLMLSALTLSCTTTGNKEDEPTGDIPGQEVTEAPAEAAASELPEENSFSYLFNPSPCDAITSATAAGILGLAVDQVVVNANASGTTSCSWGYYPDDRMEGINLNVRLIHEDENTTLLQYENDAKNMKDPPFESQRVETVSPDLDGPAFSTYRNGLLRVFVSKDSHLEFKIGPAMPPEEMAARNYKEKVISFAEAFMNR